MRERVRDLQGARGHWLAPGETDQELAYEVMRALASRIVPRWLGPLIFEGGHHVPAEGPALLVANHHGTLDPIMMALGLSRHVHFIADAWLGHWRLGNLLRAAGSLILQAPRRGDSLLLLGEEALRAGQLVGVFPEGMDRFRMGDRLALGTFHQGFARLWWQVRDCSVPVLPVGIVPLRGMTSVPLPGGWFGWPEGVRALLFHGARVRFGPPLALALDGAPELAIPELVDTCRRAISELMGPWASLP